MDTEMALGRKPLPARKVSFLCILAYLMPEYFSANILDLSRWYWISCEFPVIYFMSFQSVCYFIFIYLEGRMTFCWFIP